MKKIIIRALCIQHVFNAIKINPNLNLDVLENLLLSSNVLPPTYQIRKLQSGNLTNLKKEIMWTINYLRYPGVNLIDDKRILKKVNPYYKLSNKGGQTKQLNYDQAEKIFNYVQLNRKNKIAYTNLQF